MPKGSRKRRIAKRISYIIGGLCILLAIAGWIFMRYYFQDIINDYYTGKFREAARIATKGQFSISIGRLTYNDGILICKNFELVRVAIDSNDTGLVLERLTADTLHFGGLNIFELLRGRGAFMNRMEMHAPKIWLTEVSQWRAQAGKVIVDKDSLALELPERLPVISIDSFILTDMQIHVPKKFLPAGEEYYQGASAHLAGFLLNNNSLKTEPLLYSKHIELFMPKARYDVDDPLYVAEVGNVHLDVTDSTATVDTISYSPRFSEEEFTAKNNFLRGRLDFNAANIFVKGLDIMKLIAGSKISVHKCTVGSWSFDYYSDKRKVRDPHGPSALMPNDIARSFHFPVALDSLVLTDGKIKIRERAPGSDRSGVLSFDKVRIAASPYVTDTSSEKCGDPTRIFVSAIFQGEASVSAAINYDLQKAALDLRIDATLGKISAKRFNTFLVPNERKELTDGTIEGGKMVMNIKGGVATTTVTPIYNNLAMKILTDQGKVQRGFLEGFKTLIANTFVFRKNNPGPYDKGPISATTSRSRNKSEEFLQFIWLALRRSLGKVIGGFE